MSIKIKFLLIISVLLVCSTATIFYINRESFISDKRSYLYSTALERVEAQSSTFDRDFDGSFERIRSALQLFDPTTQQFPAQVKSLAQSQKWGDISLFVVQEGFPIRKVDSLGTDSNVSEPIMNRLSGLKDGDVVVESDLAKPDKVQVFFSQGPFRVYGSLNFPFFKDLQTQGEMGYLLAKKNQWFFPPNADATLRPMAENLQALFNEGNSGVKEITANSRSYLVSYRKLPQLDAYIFEAFDKKNVFAVLDSTMNKTLIASLVILVVGLIAMFLSVDSLTGNLSRLADAMRVFASNGSAKPVKISSGDEVGQMADVFNSMQAKIESLLSQTQEKARMQAELETAKEVQATLLPKTKVEDDRYMLKGYYQPASECGGDLWFHNCGNDKIFMFIGDATGHGVPAALITAATRSILSLAVDEDIWSPGKILAMINKVLCDVAKGEKMMTAFAAVLDLTTGTLTYANASHEAPLLLPLTEEGRKFKKSDLVFLSDVNGKRLGHEKASTYEEASVQFKAGQTLFAYTDGLTDAKNAKDEIFGERTLMKLATDASNKGSQRSLHDQIAKRTVEFTENIEQPDDITFVSLHLREA